MSQRKNKLLFSRARFFPFRFAAEETTDCTDSLL